MAPTTSTPLLSSSVQDPTPGNHPQPHKTPKTYFYALAHQPALLPLTGIYHFTTHPYLHPLLRTRLLPAILLSTTVTTLLFTLTYLPQALFLLLFHRSRHSALINAAFLVLGEGATITALLFEAFFVDEVLADVFDCVLVERGGEGVVGRGRGVVERGQARARGLDPRMRLDDYAEGGDGGGAGGGSGIGIGSRSSGSGGRRDRGKNKISKTYSPFSLRQIGEFILLLPLNFVPWVGVPLFIFGTGWRAGPLHHFRYFRLRGLGKEERREAVRRRRGGYTAFGCVALVLQLIPVLSMVFLLTTAAGSALWAAQIEHEEGRVPEDHDGSLQLEREERPPEYSEYVDDPV